MVAFGRCVVVCGGLWIVGLLWVLLDVVQWILDCRRWVVGGGRGVVSVR